MDNLLFAATKESGKSEVMSSYLTERAKFDMQKKAMPKKGE